MARLPVVAGPLRCMCGCRQPPAELPPRSTRRRTRLWRRPPAPSQASGAAGVCVGGWVWGWGCVCVGVSGCVCGCGCVGVCVGGCVGVWVGGCGCGCGWVGVGVWGGGWGVGVGLGVGGWVWVWVGVGGWVGGWGWGEVGGGVRWGGGERSRRIASRSGMSIYLFLSPGAAVPSVHTRAHAHTHAHAHTRARAHPHPHPHPHTPPHPPPTHTHVQVAAWARAAVDALKAAPSQAVVPGPTGESCVAVLARMQPMPGAAPVM